MIYFVFVSQVEIDIFQIWNALLESHFAFF
jgi:hypothetical protein